MLPFHPPENKRKLGFLMFSGRLKGNKEKERAMSHPEGIWGQRFQLGV